MEVLAEKNKKGINMTLQTTPFLALVTVLGAFSVAAQEARLWPTSEWDRSTPEAEDIDAAVLDELDAEFASGEHGYIDGVMIFRNGHLVYEKAYENDYDRLFEDRDQTRWQYNYYDPDWHPYFERSRLHTMQSISKSVTSALIGIAIRRGEIPGVDIPVMPYFDDYDPVDTDPRRQVMTLRDLLTMTAGIDWDESTVTYTDPRNSCAAMENSEDWIRYVLDQPMRAAPGEEFEYNSGVSVMLAHILLKATGEHADAYARRHLFGPLGIDSFYWKKTPTGLVDTEGGLYLEPEDLAKFGYLYQNAGMWNEQRILPEGWVAATMEPAIQVPGEVFSYGYQWWLLPYEGETHSWVYTGLGYGGQRLLVIPEYDLIAVFTGWNIYDKPAFSAQIASERVLRAVR